MKQRTKSAGSAIFLLALAGCASAPAFDQQRAECKQLSAESERAGCLQKVDAAERDYERKHNETKIEKDYKRKLEERR